MMEGLKVLLVLFFHFKLKKETDYYDLEEFRSQWQAKLDEEIRIEEEEKLRKIQQKKALLETLGEEVFKVLIVIIVLLLTIKIIIV